jgi:hypothetical protein
MIYDEAAMRERVTYDEHGIINYLAAISTPRAAGMSMEEWNLLEKREDQKHAKRGTLRGDNQQ